MKTSSTMVFLGTTALTGALFVGSSLQGCRGDGGVNAFGGNATTTKSTGGTGGTGTGGAVSATVVTIPQITDPSAAGHVGTATPITVQGAVAMSIKFLVSKSSSGSCLWGVFLSAPNLTTTGPHTGILALSYGSPATVSAGGTKAYCPTIQPLPPQKGMPAGDSFPDDVSPGDVLDVTGVTDAYVPSTCAAADAGLGASQVPGIQINKVTSVTRHAGKVALPTPYKLTSSDLTTLAAGSDSNWLDQWGSVRVEADNVTVQNQLGQLTDTYGHMLLQEGTNGIQVGDKLYYVGYVKAADACYSGPSYPMVPPFTLNSVTGFVYLDYCNWGLVPSDKCHDLNPPSDDCENYVAPPSDAGSDASSDDGGSDAGASDAAVSDAGPNPALVCTHTP